MAEVDLGEELGAEVEAIQSFLIEGEGEEVKVSLTHPKIMAHRGTSPIHLVTSFRICTLSAKNYFSQAHVCPCDLLPD